MYRRKTKFCQKVNPIFKAYSTLLDLQYTTARENLPNHVKISAEQLIAKHYFYFQEEILMVNF